MRRHRKGGARTDRASRRGEPQTPHESCRVSQEPRRLVPSPPRGCNRLSLRRGLGGRLGTHKVGSVVGQDRVWPSADGLHEPGARRGERGMAAAATAGRSRSVAGRLAEGGGTARKLGFAGGGSGEQFERLGEEDRESQRADADGLGRVRIGRRRHVRQDNSEQMVEEGGGAGGGVRVHGEYLEKHCAQSGAHRRVVASGARADALGQKRLPVTRR
mmetsp:Transcript_21754/g.70260  ORF Transcript_21754/g.70260 Transcript_21754/m.70260 type:complete len:216 (+) Transcript_21754:328-975(+)